MAQKKLIDRIRDLERKDYDELMASLDAIRSDRDDKSKVDGFKEYYHNYISKNRKKSYARSVNLSLRYLQEFFPGESIRKIDAMAAQSFIDYLAEEKGRGYVRYLANLNAAFNRAVKWKLITENPFQYVEYKKMQAENPVYLDENELDRILETTKNQTHRDIFLCAFHTGGRLAEVTCLKWKNIDLQRRTIEVGDADFTTKNSKTRTIPMTKRVHEVLSIRIQRRRKSSEYVFNNPNGYHYNKDYISKSFKKIIRSLNMDERVTFHSLRHSCASYLVQKGVDLYTVKEILGHSSVSVTERYAHLQLDNLVDAMKVFDGEAA